MTRLEPTSASDRRLGALNCGEERPRSVTALAPHRDRRTVVTMGVVAVWRVPASRWLLRQRSRGRGAGDELRC
jgi:hypothetical protein